jgi:hypothetical protein
LDAFHEPSQGSTRRAATGHREIRLAARDVLPQSQGSTRRAATGYWNYISQRVTSDLDPEKVRGPHVNSERLPPVLETVFD